MESLATESVVARTAYALIEESNANFPYSTEKEQLEVLRKGNRREIEHAIKSSVMASRVVAAKQKKAIYVALQELSVKGAGSITQMIDRLWHLEHFSRTWQHSYREAYLSDQDNMEELDVEDFYTVLDSALDKMN